MSQGEEKDYKDLLRRAHPSHDTYGDGTEPRPDSQEICICAAIRFKDGTIIRGHRHDSCYKTAMVMPALRDYLHQAEQGFVTSANRFVDRGTAWCLQRDAGRVSADPGGYRGEILFSEDLY